MYKGHSSRREYLAWCAKEWAKHHPGEYDHGEETINHWVEGFVKDGAVGTCDVFGQAPSRGRPVGVLVFGHLLPSTADALARAFSEALVNAIDQGYVFDDSEGATSPFEKKAPSSNTGLTSPPSAN